MAIPLIHEATRAEFRKLERPVNEGDFRYIKPVGAET